MYSYQNHPSTPLNVIRYHVFMVTDEPPPKILKSINKG